jgi:lytic murein transglycosylase
MPQHQQAARAAWDAMSTGRLRPRPSPANNGTDNNGPLTMRRFGLAGLATLAVLLASVPALAQPNCRNTGNFDSWLADFKREALSQGISQSALNAAAPYLVLDQRIINIDRGQRFFAQTFLEMSDKMLAGGRLPGGAAKIKQHRGLFDREEKEFGVPAPVITAFWGLESDFGAGQGKDHSIRSVATLAYDCRRPDMFRQHLFDSLRIIERRDLRPEEMIGSWAGELGQTQFMPSEYMAYAVDYDGDGRRDLIKSVSDVIGSTGKYLEHLGWKRGEPWMQEVRVPATMKWEEADLTIQHPRSQWGKWGVTRPNGSALQADNVPASLVLPMGRLGPAFLAYDNFQAYLKWNASLMYSMTAAYYATRLEGAPAMSKGSPNIPKLTIDENRELQTLLQKRGYDVGRIDGVLGLKSRSAVRDVQLKLKMPADSWPTPELLQRLRSGA